MREIIHGIVDKFFDRYPFSQKEELLRENVRENLTEKIADTEDQEFDKGIDIISNCRSLESVCDAAGIRTDEAELKITDDGACTEKDAKAIWRKARWYIYAQCICIAMIFECLWMDICQYSPRTVIFNTVLIAGLCGILVLGTRRKRRYLKEIDYSRKSYEPGVRKFFCDNNDKYSKKLINTMLLSVGMCAYVVSMLVRAVMMSAYTWSDVCQQLTVISNVAEIVVFFLFKNLLCKRLTDIYFVEKRRESFAAKCRLLGLVAAAYWIVVFVVLIIIRPEFYMNWLAILAVVYFILCIVYDLTVRKAIVFRNITVNVKRIVFVSVLSISVLLYNVMSMNIYVIQPYIDTVAKVADKVEKIEYDDASGVYTITADDDDFKVLQLTDIHLGGSVFSSVKDIKALEACYALINYTKPDLVIVTGDLVFPMGIMSFSLNNNAPIMQFANFMRNTGIPWAFTYGNHDTEDMATLDEAEFDSLMKSLSFKSSGNLLYPYTQPDIYGRSNQLIEIRNTDGSLRQALFLLDSNDYVEGAGRINEYDYIHDDQVDWYRQQVIKLSDEAGYTVPSMLFFHIPLREYKEANDLLEAGSDEVKYYYGELGEKMIDKICCSKYESKLFDTAVELGSTKAMFCGHDHYNNQSVEYKGIRLTYGYSIDYLVMPGIDEDTKQRGATLVNIDTSGGFTIDPIRLIDITK